jgi:hypothetical protein
LFKVFEKAYGVIAVGAEMGDEGSELGEGSGGFGVEVLEAKELWKTSGSGREGMESTRESHPLANQNNSINIYAGSVCVGRSARSVLQPYSDGLSVVLPIKE